MHHRSANGLILVGEGRAKSGGWGGGDRGSHPAAAAPPSSPCSPSAPSLSVCAPQKWLDRFSPSSAYSEHPSTPYDMASPVVLSVIPQSKMYLKNVSYTIYWQAPGPRTVAINTAWSFKILSKPITVFD